MNRTEKLLLAVRDHILPRTRREVARGNHVFGGAILHKESFELVLASSNCRVDNPLFHGEIATLNEFFSKPEHPDPASLVFIATHEPCPMCAAAIAWAGFNEVWVLFDYDSVKNDFAMPVDLMMYRELFGSTGVRPENPFFTKSSLREAVAADPEKDRLAPLLQNIIEAYAAFDVQNFDYPGMECRRNHEGNTMPGLTRIDIIVQEEDFDRATGILVRHSSYGWEEISLPTGETRLRLHSDNPTLTEGFLLECAALLPHTPIERTEIHNQDWTKAWREFFTPVEAGLFLVLPPWLTNTPAGGRRHIVIEPKSAFGTGHHATTVLCLKALSARISAGLRPNLHVLDLGTGSGVLGIGCAMYGHTVVGTDIDPVAVANARENIVINKVEQHMHAILGSTQAVAGQQFDMIVANILAGPLRELAPDILALHKPGGCLILSGLLTVQADNVAACYAAALGQPERLEEGDWVSLVWPGTL